MSVTQNYTINTSSEVFQHIRTAVIKRLEDKVRVSELTDRHLPDFLKNELLRGAQALVAINYATVQTREETSGALEGEMLQTAIAAMRCMLKDRRGERWASLGAPTNEALNAALHFLENQK